MRFKQLCAGIAAGACLAGTLLPIGAFAEESTQKTYTTGLFTYGYVDGGLEICGVDTSTLSATIPAESDGYKIVGIADGAFYGCTNLESVTLSEGLQYIGRHAFSGCEKLRKLDIPDSVTTLGGNTFSGCVSLEELHLPEKLTEIPEGMCYTCLALDTVNLPDTVTAIGDEAFYQCDSLEEVTLPANLATFGNYAFGFCGNLQNVDIPKGVTKLSGGTFAGCTSFTEFTIPKQMEDLGSLAFLGCTGLSAFSAEEGNLKYTVQDGVVYSENNTMLIAYPAGNSQQSFTIPEGVTIVHDAAFFAAEHLTEVNFPSTLQYIGAGAFENCTALKSVLLPEGTEILYENAFTDCTALHYVSLPSTLKGVGNYVFYNCPQLREITVPANCRTIGDYAFGYVEETDADGNAAPVKLEGFKQRGGGIGVWKIVGIVAGVIAAGAVVVFLVRVIRKNQMTAEEHDQNVMANEEYESIAEDPAQTDADPEQEE
ncbi:MAG: leucine-rich repeat domain-containing protein [Oscillospiraceae bacterium]|nr:leucine-rich repeat domain-containing protein [Oscillospiraceae bacterium]